MFQLMAWAKMAGWTWAKMASPFLWQAQWRNMWWNFGSYWENALLPSRMKCVASMGWASSPNDGEFMLSIWWGHNDVELGGFVELSWAAPVGPYTARFGHIYATHFTAQRREKTKIKINEPRQRPHPVFETFRFQCPTFKLKTLSCGKCNMWCNTCWIRNAVGMQRFVLKYKC